MTSQEKTSTDADVSSLLRAWSDGDQNALDKLAPIVYDELRRLAGYYLNRERSGHSLQATALVNEAYLRLVDYKRMQWENRAHFFAVSAQLMRRILVDAARRRATAKHGGGMGRIHLDDVAYLDLRRETDTRLIVLNDALDELGRSDGRKARVVELRYFAGLTVEETAAVLKVSVETVTRDWRLARGWLLMKVGGAESPA